MPSRRDFLRKTALLTGAALSTAGPLRAAPRSSARPYQFSLTITGNNSEAGSALALRIAPGGTAPERLRAGRCDMTDDRLPIGPVPPFSRPPTEGPLERLGMGFLDLNHASPGAGSGDLAPYSRVYIYNRASDSLAPIFLDDCLQKMTANPMVADSEGNFEICYLTKGDYRVVIRSRDDQIVLGRYDIAVQGDMETSFVRSFHSFSNMVADRSLSYRAGTGRKVVRNDALVHVSKGDFAYQVAPETATDHHLLTKGGVKLYVVAGAMGLDVRAFGADDTGQTSCEEAFAKAVEAARAAGLNVFVPAGMYCVEQGIDIRGSSTISGYAINLDIVGAGQEATVFFSRGAPDYVFHIDARYIKLRGISVWGSRDQIRDSSQSARIGVWIKNMREGALTDFKVQHIVGSGLQIDKCIVSRIDGVVYRCGSDVARAVEQTDGAQDGCQASWVRLNCEDGHGALGACRFLSHRNTHLEIKLENQPYHICEVDAPTGRPGKAETVTFSGGATATVALTSPQPSAHGKSQLVIEDVSGTVSAQETFTTSGGVTGTVAAITAPTGPQFETSGDYGVLDIFANQNRLRTEGAEVIFSRADAHTQIRNIAIRGVHLGTGVSVTGTDYMFDRVFLSPALIEVEDEAGYSYAMEITGARNHVTEYYSENAKGIHIGEFAHRCKIGHFVQQTLFGQSALIRADDCEIATVDCTHAEYSDPGMVFTHVVNIMGDNSRFGTGGGRLGFSRTPAGNNAVSISGTDSLLGPVVIEEAGAANIGVFMSGERCRLTGTRMIVAETAEGVRCAALDGVIDNPSIQGGAICIDLRATGARLIGGTLSGYAIRAVNAQPNATVEAMRIQDVTCHTPALSASTDIVVGANVTHSHVLNNNARRGRRVITLGSGTGNISSGNII